MIAAWRLVKWSWRHAAMTGEGARRDPGRWNPAGRGVVYLAESSGLAVLEMWVHLDPAQVQHHFALIRVEIPDSIRILEVEERSLPPGWNRNPPSPATRRIGARWLEKGRTPMLRVPSVIVPHATNLVLNPEHPDSRRLVISTPERFKLDLRMLK